MSLTLQGSQALRAGLAQLGDKAPVSLEGGLFEFGSLVEGDAKELCPVDTGNLRDSAFTITPTLEHTGVTTDVDAQARALAEKNADQITAVVGFGGPSQVYALIQHERTDFRHKVGQAKYLQTALANRQESLPDVLVARMKRDLAKWVG